MNRNSRLRNFLLLLIGIFLGHLQVVQADSTFEDVLYRDAALTLARGGLSDAKRATELLDQAEKMVPLHPYYPRLKMEIKVLFRAEFGINAAREASRKAKIEADRKFRSMRLSLEPSKLTGENNPKAAAKFKAQAEIILEDAAANELRARQSLAMALDRMRNFILEMQDKGEETVAVCMASAAKEVATRNTRLLAGVDPPFKSAFPILELERMRITVESKHAMVRKGVLKEKEGKVVEAFELYKEAGHSRGMQRLTGEDED